MKKFIYSNYTKGVAVVLFVLCIIMGALTASRGMSQYYDEDEIVYHFEREFNDASFFWHLLEAPESAVSSAYFNLYNVEDAQKTNIDGRTIEKEIEYNLNSLYCFDNVDYFIEWNGKVFKNCDAMSADDFKDATFYKISSRDKYGNHDYETSRIRNYYSFHSLDRVGQYDKTSPITVACAVKEEYAKEYERKWNTQAQMINETLVGVMFFVVLALIILIYLICVCGKNKDGDYKSLWVDKIWTEIHLVFMGVSAVIAIIICAILIDDYYTGHFMYNIMMWIIGGVAGLAGIVALTSGLSVIRNIKCGKFVQSSIILRIVRWTYFKLKDVIRALCYALSKKSGIILITMLFVYTAIIGLCGIFTLETPLALIFAVILFGFASFVVAYRDKDLEEVKTGASEIRNGNLSYKIPELKSEDMKLFAQDINDIAKGLDESVSAKIKSERLKTELITNVSHDLKTPLTSIINYADLLSQMELTPTEANDYVKIISQKTLRLKNLTNDLFDISKAQSGNEQTELEKIDLSILVKQTIGELDEVIKASGVDFEKYFPENEAYIMADGKKISRVLENLIVNACKFSLKGTRVYIVVTADEAKVKFEIKNIASYKMDFENSEITERFVRGDKSRSTEGNGLGLAIAKSYTELCGGIFEIKTDGDLFKASLTFVRI